MKKALASLAAVVVLAGGVSAGAPRGAQPDGVPPFLCRVFVFLC